MVKRKNSHLGRSQGIFDEDFRLPRSSKNCVWRRQSCPHCGNDDGCYFLTPKTDDARKTRTGAAPSAACGSARVPQAVLGPHRTVFHGTKIRVRTWCSSSSRCAAPRTGRRPRDRAQVRTHPKTAWFMTHRIREAMKRANHWPGCCSGTITADETFFGGNVAQDERRAAAQRTSPRLRSSRWSTKRPAKFAHMVIPNVPWQHPEASQTPSQTSTTVRCLHTDDLKSYGTFFMDARRATKHVNHAQRVSTNGWAARSRPMKPSHTSRN